MGQAVGGRKKTVDVVDSGAVSSISGTRVGSCALSRGSARRSGSGGSIGESMSGSTVGFVSSTGSSNDACRTKFDSEATNDSRRTEVLLVGTTPGRSAGCGSCHMGRFTIESRPSGKEFLSRWGAFAAVRAEIGFPWRFSRARARARRCRMPSNQPRKSKDFPVSCQESWATGTRDGFPMFWAAPGALEPSGAD